MNVNVKLYFQWPSGNGDYIDDSILLEANDIDEMKDLIESELVQRNAIFTGLEEL